MEVREITVALLLIVSLWRGAAYADDLAPIRAILQLPESQIDLGRAKLTIDRMVDSSIDVEVNLREINSIVKRIKSGLLRES